MNLPRPSQHQKTLSINVLKEILVILGVVALTFGASYSFMNNPVYLIYTIFGLFGLIFLLLLWAAITPIKKNKI